PRCTRGPGPYTARRVRSLRLSPTMESCPPQILYPGQNRVLEHSITWDPERSCRYVARMVQKLDLAENTRYYQAFFEDCPPQKRYPLCVVKSLSARRISYLAGFSHNLDGR